ncbi:hypothetical protein DKX38_005819 [Salix brachista]|uniref:Uncharacterized protein n=1 Tax=Salix brachista TaxID=2182728 RepID=A0A5N5N0Z0_9ROSI|nr:hypothetical protein DKX38_005819 [Salix brachista]
MRLSMTSMKAADAKEVSTSVSAIANEKIKAEKEATGKKKTGEIFSTTYVVLASSAKILLFVAPGPHMQPPDTETSLMVLKIYPLITLMNIVHSFLKLFVNKFETNQLMVSYPVLAAVKKKNLIVDKPSDDLAGNAYEALDDFDFM